MSFIANFLDITEKSRPKIIRILKLIQAVERRTKEINFFLKNMRDGYLNDLKDKNEDNKEKLNIDKTCYKELLNLSEYKQNLIQELIYIKNKLINNMNKIIEEGEKDCLAELNKNNKNKKNSEIKEERLLNKKTKRSEQKTINKDDFKKFENILPNNEEDDTTVYCICKNKENGKMIMCDKCQNWFHFKCINLDENSNPNEFFCQSCTEDNKENKENNTSYNKKTKKNKNNKKKKV